MLMAKYGSVVYLYLTLCWWEISAVPFNPTVENDALSPFGEEHDLPHPTFGNRPVEGLAYENPKIASKFMRDQIPGSPIGYGSVDSSDLISQEKRAARNFLRFGRGPPKNFIRFGRGDPTELGLGLIGDEMEENGLDKRGGARNFLRFGRGSPKNFIRFGRASDKTKNAYMSNIVRLGRSTSKQLEKCKECSDPEESVGSSQNGKSSTNLSKNRIEKRSKRSIPAFYDDLLFMAPTPLSWIENLGRFEPNPSQSGPNGSPVTGNGQKRAHSRGSFLRYGRDPLDLHFLRFGKRGLPSASGSDANQEDGFPRDSRLNKNFLRFG